RHDGERRVPDGREAGLEMDGLVVLDLEGEKLLDLTRHDGMVGAVAAASQREARVDDRREDGSKAGAARDAPRHPGPRPSRRPRRRKGVRGRRSIAGRARSTPAKNEAQKRSRRRRRRWERAGSPGGVASSEIPVPSGTAQLGRYAEMIESGTTIARDQEDIR